VRDGSKTDPHPATEDQLWASTIVSTGCIAGSCLKVDMPKDVTNSLGIHWPLSAAGLAPEQLYLRYYIKLGPAWNPYQTDSSTGGKFPGLADARTNADPSLQCGNGGEPGDGRNCWSMRSVFHDCSYTFNGPHDACGEFKKPNSSMRFGSYLYFYGQQDGTGSAGYWDSAPNFSPNTGAACQTPADIGCGMGDRGMFVNDRWYRVEMFVKMNTPGVANGVIRGWVDGVLSYEKTNMIFRIPGHDNLHVRTVWLNVYKGGVLGNLSSSEIYLDQMVVATDAEIGPWSSSGGGTAAPPAPPSLPSTVQMPAPTPPKQSPSPSAPPASPPSTGQTPAQASPPIPSAGLDLGNNEWRLLNPQPSDRYVTGNWPSVDVLSSQRNTPSAREYSGIHYGDGKIFYFGGGHGGYAGNDVEVYGIAGNIWWQSYKPEVCDRNDPACNGIYGGWGVARLTPLGRPYTEHTFQKFAWDPVTKRLIGILSSGTFAYDPAAATWTKLAPPLMGIDIYTWNLLPFDPDLGAIIGIVTASSGVTQRGVYKLTRTGWQYLGDPPFTSSVIYAAYMPDQHTHIVYTWGIRPGDPRVFWKFDARTQMWTKLNPPVEALLIDSIDYDTKNRVMIGIQHSNLGVFKVWGYDPAANTWTQMTVTGPVPSQPGAAAAWGPLLRYDPIHNVFIFLRAGSGWTETWAYRYRR